MCDEFVNEEIFKIFLTASIIIPPLGSLSVWTLGCRWLDITEKPRHVMAASSALSTHYLLFDHRAFAGHQSTGAYSVLPLLLRNGRASNREMHHAHSYLALISLIIIIKVVPVLLGREPSHMPIMGNPI